MRSFIKPLTATMLAAVIWATFANNNAAASISNLEFDSPVFFGNGLQSSLAANSSGLVLQFNRGPTDDEIWYNVGKLGMTHLVWGAQQYSGVRGHWPSVALSKEGYVLVVYNDQDRKNGCHLYYRVGKINPQGDQNQSITWLTNVMHWDAGYKASVAINDKGVIVGVHETGHASNGMYYRVGHLRNPAGGDYTVQWDSPSWGVYYNDGVSPHIALNNLNQVVEVHEVAGEHLLHYWRGTVSGGQINFAQSRRYDNSAVEPAVALLDNGVVLEVHALGGLISRAGKLNPHNDWEIQWAEPTKIDPETSIGYPAVAAGAGFAFETHQRPPSSTFSHELYTSIASIQDGGGVNYGLFVKGAPEGWSDASNGAVAGTTGQNRKSDAFYINGFGFPAEFRIHVAQQGWRNWTPAVEGAYDSGVGKQLEAIQFRFPQGIPSGKHIMARVHLQNVGWTPVVAVKDQTILGTTGLSRPLEAIQIAVLSYANGTLVRGSSDKVYVVLNNHRHLIPDQTTFNAMGYDYYNILWLSDDLANLIPEGVPFPSAAPLSGLRGFANGTLVRGSTGNVYVLLNDHRHWIPDEKTFEAMEYDWSKVRKFDDAVNTFPERAPFPSVAQ